MFTPALVLLMVASAPAPRVDDNQAYFGIFAETKMMRMAGMPLMDVDMPPGMGDMPGMEFVTGKPSRALNIRLWSPTIAPKDATAYVTPPAGLKQGNRLDLELFRPKPGQVDGGSSRDFDPDKNPEFTIKMYWGSSETVKPGQPKVIRWADIAPDAKAAMKAQARDVRAGADYFYKPDWTTAFWPTKKQPGKIAADASLVGTYSLTTNYCGSVALDAPSNVNFLGPIAFSAPSFDKKIDMNKSMNFQWALIPNVLGQYASVMGMEGKNTIIIWSSSEVFGERLMGDMGFMQMADVRDMVAQNMFMGPDRVKVSVPAAIFNNADMVMMNMIGYGPGSALDKVQPIPRIQTKTTFMGMLGGKKMQDMGR